jgi:hypothetical protein
MPATALAAIRTWLGREPVLDPITGVVTTSGKGLLGFVYTRDPKSLPMREALFHFSKLTVSAIEENDVIGKINPDRPIGRTARESELLGLCR